MNCLTVQKWIVKDASDTVPPRGNVTIPRECSNPGHDSTQRTTGIHHVRSHAVTGAATQGSLHVVATRGESVSTHMPKKSRVENWLHECKLFASVTLPLGSTVLTKSLWRFLF